jgi:protein-S-isoprenylcysteine O-methyltransferase Ste14
MSAYDGRGSGRAMETSIGNGLRSNARALWTTTTLSILVVGADIEGIRLLRKVGKPTDELEDTTVLVEVGAYKYIRHPLYASLLLLGLGAFLKAPSLLAGALTVAASAFLVATAKVEEKLNLEKFGSQYADYMKRTKMFVPYLF